MQPRPIVHIACVGAIYIDTIWTCSVPHFPHEDTKLRAEKVQKRRGGNAGNTLEVLNAIICESQPEGEVEENQKRPYTRLYLLAAVPQRPSEDADMIIDSLPGVRLMGILTRPECRYAPASMVIQSRDRATRTIISHSSNLPEMTVDEFKESVHVWRDPQDSDTPGARRTTWVHFEGRNSTTTHDCISHIRGTMAECNVSVECEKPEREGLVESAKLADVIFFSKTWAQTRGFNSPFAFLSAFINDNMFDREEVTLICTWGAYGAAAIWIRTSMDEGHHVVDQAQVPAWLPYSHPDRVVDTNGAGDTFVAGMLFKMTHHPQDTLQEKLSFAVEVASRKVYQDGFKGLGKDMVPRSLHPRGLD